MLGIFDTDAENNFYNKSFRVTILKKIIRQFPKMIWISKSLVKNPSATIQYQYRLFVKRLQQLGKRIGVVEEPKTDEIYDQIKVINEKQHIALKSYNIHPFNNHVYLFKAKKRLYFVDDFKYLGWQKYAKKGVKVFDVPGDHETMLHQPNVIEFGKKLQDALNNS